MPLNSATTANVFAAIASQNLASKSFTEGLKLSPNYSAIASQTFPQHWTNLVSAFVYIQDAYHSSRLSEFDRKHRPYPFRLFIDLAITVSAPYGSTVAIARFQVQHINPTLVIADYPPRADIDPTGRSSYPLEHPLFFKLPLDLNLYPYALPMIPALFRVNFPNPRQFLLDTFRVMNSYDYKLDVDQKLFYKIYSSKGYYPLFVEMRCKLPLARPWSPSYPDFLPV